MSKPKLNEKLIQDRFYAAHNGSYQMLVPNFTSREENRRLREALKKTRLYVGACSGTHSKHPNVADAIEALAVIAGATKLRDVEVES